MLWVGVFVTEGKNPYYHSKEIKQDSTGILEVSEFRITESKVIGTNKSRKRNLIDESLGFVE